jgi:preprotein translocase subunit SecF
MAAETIGLIALCIILIGAFSSCSRRQVEFIETIDTLIIEKIDTVHSEKVVKEAVKEKRESTSNRFVVVTVAGDTVKDYRTEYVYVEKDSTLVDSLAKYRAMYNNLKKSKSNVREVETKVPPSIWQKLEYGFYGMIVGVLLYIVLITNWRKKS